MPRKTARTSNEPLVETVNNQWDSTTIYAGRISTEDSSTQYSAMKAGLGSTSGGRRRGGVFQSRRTHLNAQPFKDASSQQRPDITALT